MKDISRRIFLQKGSLAAISFIPAIDTLSKVLGIQEKPLGQLIDLAFRLTVPESLLNLEFYFINFQLEDYKLTATYNQEESYMIVRLPQQHIAEQALSFLDEDFTALDTFTAVTRISGYSYLVFRVMYPENSNSASIFLNDPKYLMDWNNELSGNFKYKLVVRQNLSESLFEIRRRNLVGEETTENIYPLGYKRTSSFDKNPPSKYNINAFPKAYGDPITAIEAPWRMFLSPKLPNQDKFKFHWEIPPLPQVSDIYIKPTELWTASLSIKEDPQYKRKKVETPEEDQTEESQSLQSDLEKEIKSIELMLIGSPDYPNPFNFDFDNNKPVKTGKNTPSYQSLPLPNHRSKLIQLYIKYKILARTEKLMFSPLGISTFIELKNTAIETSSKNDSNDLLSWKHLISFGRDEEVEIVTLIIDKELGHKYLHISTTKRRTKRGTSYLDYREYIMPLDITKDFKNHENEINKETGRVKVSKFNCPFQQIEIKEVKPKRIIPVDKTENRFVKKIANTEEVGSNNKSESRCYIPIDFKTKKPVKFEYEGTDWQNQIIKFNKGIQAIELNVSEAVRTKLISVTDITEFFDGGANSLKKDISKVNQKIQELKDKLELLEGQTKKTAEDTLSEWKDFYEDYKNTLIALERISYASLKRLASEIHSKLEAINEEKVKKLRDFILNEVLIDTPDSDLYNNLIPQLSSKLNEALTNIKTNYEQTQLYHGIEEVLEACKKLISIKAKQYNDQDIKEAIKKYLDYSPLKLIQGEIRNNIEIFQQDVAFTVRNMSDEADKLGKDFISNLKTDFINFNGELKLVEEKILGEAKATGERAIDFFNQYASVPQLEQAQVYVSSLNRIAGAKLPVKFKYAQDYLNAQLDLTKLDIEKNPSKVFAKITDASQEFLKGQLRRVSSDLGGFMNPELPVEYLTYLKDPKKLGEGIIKEFNESGIAKEVLANVNNIQSGYNDLVFISGQAKDTWAKVREIRPDDFFSGLDAKILGSIQLKDVLGLDFELPRLSIVKDKLGVPKKAVYNFLTNKIKEKDLDLVRFYAKNKGKNAMFQIYLEKDIEQPRNYESFIKLSNFSIGIKPLGLELLTIFFSKLESSSGNGKSKKVNVEINDVKFGGPLDFVGKLAESLKIPGNGLRVVPSATEIDIGYLYTLPGIETPSFNLSNLKFDLAFNIPFPRPSDKEVQELSTTFSINKPEDKFLVSVGIFGGRGHFVIKTTPTKIIELDAGIEFGGYLGINLGIAKGYVFLFAGIRYQVTKSDGVTLTAYLICSGGVTVFGFISVSVTFLLSMRYNIRKNELYGTAAVSYSIKIGFFTKSFTLRYSKTIQGTKGKKIDPNQTNSYNYKKTKSLHASLDKTISSRINDADIPPVRLKSFEEIYSKDQWKQYFNTFYRN